MIDNQSMAIMSNKYFRLVFNTTLIGENINTNDINTNDTSSSTSVVDRQDATTEICDCSNVSFNSN